MMRSTPAPFAGGCADASPSRWEVCAALWDSVAFANAGANGGRSWGASTACVKVCRMWGSTHEVRLPEHPVGMEYRVIGIFHYSFFLSGVGCCSSFLVEFRFCRIGIPTS